MLTSTLSYQVYRHKIVVFSEIPGIFLRGPTESGEEVVESLENDRSLIRF